MYILITAAMEVDGHSASASIIATSVEMETSFKDSLLYDEENNPTANYISISEDNGIITEYYSGTGFYGDLTISSMRVKTVKELCNIVVDGRTG